jgi:hypothetical protein
MGRHGTASAAPGGAFDFIHFGTVGAKALAAPGRGNTAGARPHGTRRAAMTPTGRSGAAQISVHP